MIKFLIEHWWLGLLVVLFVLVVAAGVIAKIMPYGLGADEDQADPCAGIHDADVVDAGLPEDFEVPEFYEPPRLTHIEPLMVISVGGWQNNPGNLPVPGGTLVDVKLRNGTIARACVAHHLRWSSAYGANSLDIVEWRLHELDEAADLQWGQDVIDKACESEAKPLMFNVLAGGGSSGGVTSGVAAVYETTEQPEKKMLVTLDGLNTLADQHGRVTVEKEIHALQLKALAAACRYLANPTERGFLNLKSAVSKVPV